MRFAGTLRGRQVWQTDDLGRAGADDGAPTVPQERSMPCPPLPARLLIVSRTAQDLLDDRRLGRLARWCDHPHDVRLLDAGRGAGATSS
jgi:hypothetical protein